MVSLSVPTKARLPSSLRVASSDPVVQRILGRLSRPSLLSLVLDWLDESNHTISYPYIRPDPALEDGDADDFYPPARSLKELRDAYSEMQSRKGSRRELLDRILEGDWRHGLTLYQLAMADLQYLYDHPKSQRWSAYRILPLKSPSNASQDEDVLKADKKSLVVPRVHPSTFLEKLQNQVLPDVKAHYQFDRPKNLRMVILRISIIDSPYNTDLALSSQANPSSAASLDSSRTIYVAFPDGAPFIYLSRSQVIGQPSAGETKSLRALIVEGIPKALSRPRERYTLKSTSLTTRNLGGLLHTRGAGRTNAAGGGWSIYADTKDGETPLDNVLPTPPLSEASDESCSVPGLSKKRKIPQSTAEERLAKHARLVAQARFGNSAKPADGAGVERVDILMEDPFPGGPKEATGHVEDDEAEVEAEADESRAGRRTRGARKSNIDLAFQREAEAREDESNREADSTPDVGTWTPAVKLTFHGPHVFAGVRQLVEAGIIDGARMPGWMTGEEGVTIGAVRHGRIRGHKGSGV